MILTRKQKFDIKDSSYVLWTEVKFNKNGWIISYRVNFNGDWEKWHNVRHGAVKSVRQLNLPPNIDSASDAEWHPREFYDIIS